MGILAVGPVLRHLHERFGGDWAREGTGSRVGQTAPTAKFMIPREPRRKRWSQEVGWKMPTGGNRKWTGQNTAENDGKENFTQHGDFEVR